MSQPGVIDGLQFARAAETLGGTLGMSQLRRLAELQCATDGISYQISGRTDAEGRCWLRIVADGRLAVQCQRCLGPIELAIGVDCELLLAASEREIATAEDQVDRVLAGKRMSVGEMVEDEILLSLPMAPVHEQCGDLQRGPGEGRPNPFAGLAGLKGIHSIDRDESV